MDPETIIYQTGGGWTKIGTTFDGDTVQMPIVQMAELLQRNKSTIPQHIKNVFSEDGLTRNTVVANFATTAADGKTYKVDYYSLDIIISIGYRVKSLRGTQFRIWANEGLSALNSIVSAYLEFAEMQARRRTPMYMTDWIETLDGFLKFSKHEILTHAGKISTKVAERKAKAEYKKYKTLHSEDVSKVEKDYIKALEDMEMKLLGVVDKK